MEAFFTPGAELTLAQHSVAFLVMTVVGCVGGWAIYRFLWLPSYEEERKQADNTIRSLLHDPTILDAIDGTDEEWDAYQKKKGWK